MDFCTTAGNQGECSRARVGQTGHSQLDGRGAEEAQRRTKELEEAGAARAKEEAERRAAIEAKRAARELLADEIAELGDRLDVVSAFLATLPPDAIRGAVRKLVGFQKEKSATEIMQAISDASTVEINFEEDEDEL